MREMTLTALPGFPEVRAGDDLAALIARSLSHCNRTLAAGDVLVVAQKVVSKAEGRTVFLRLEAHDERELIGDGKHQRVVVNVEKFAQRVARKK